MKLTVFILYVLLLINSKVQAANPGDSLFSSSQIHSVNIDFAQWDYWMQLTANYEKTVNADSNIYLLASVTIDSIKLDSVGVRLKGNSTYKHDGMKKPLKLSFNEFIDYQRFDRLKQLNLHNGYMDPTMMREKLMLDFLNARNIPAPRCTYAEVYFNGSYIGLYKMVEEVDKRFLTTHFGNNEGNLYKGDPEGNLEWKGNNQEKYYASYDLKTNEPINNWDDLVHFIDIVNNTPMGNFKTETDRFFNAEEFIRAWAANNLFVNLDSYFFLPHNYYLYQNESSGKFEWITWDVSVSFGVFPLFKGKRSEQVDILYLPIQRHKHPLTYKMLETDDYRNQYLRAMCDFLYNDFTEQKLFPVIDSLTERIRPHLEKESPDNQMYSVADFDKNLSGGEYKNWLYEVPGLKSFIGARRNNVINQLCEMRWSCESGGSIKDSVDYIMNVYPNPASGNVNFEISLLEPENRIINYKVVNLFGEIIFDENSESPAATWSQQFSVQNLPSGIYILSASTGCISYNKKIVVIKK